MAELGLFPDGKPSRFRAGSAVLGLLAFSLAFLVLFLALRLAHVSQERDLERRRADGLLASLRRLDFRVPQAPCEPPVLSPAPRPSGPGSSGAGPEARPTPEPGRSLARVPRLSSAPRESVSELLEAGRRDFREGRYREAESNFFRAVPDSYVYLLLASLARGELREAAGFMGRAMEADPDWFRSVVPREIFGSSGEYDRVLGWLESLVRENPLDAQAKMALAFFFYHEKGPAYAKALLVEVTNAFPDNAQASRFLEKLE